MSDHMINKNNNKNNNNTTKSAIRKHQESARILRFCSILSNRYYYRHQLQKLEFCICWVMLLLTMFTQTLSPSIMSLYLKASAITRTIAYVFDLSNAFVKCKGRLPSWLLLHHGGVLLHHITFSMSISQSEEPLPLHIMSCFFLGSQSSHNTWTKTISKKLYWGNVLVGWVTALYVQYFFCVHDVVYASAGVNVMGACLLATTTGVSLLYLESSGKKKRTHATRSRTVSPVIRGQQAKKTSTIHPSCSSISLGRRLSIVSMSGGNYQCKYEGLQIVARAA